MIKALISFVKFADGKLLAFVQGVVVSLTGNPDFPTTTPAIADVSDAAGVFAEALSVAASGNRAAIADKNAKKKVVIAMLRQLVFSVNTIANGDKTMLSSTGFELSKGKNPPVITKPGNLQVVNGMNSGELQVSIDRVPGAVSYLYAYTTDATMADNSWVVMPSSQRRIKFGELEKGKEYFVRVAAVGRKGQVVYSDPMSRIVI